MDESKRMQRLRKHIVICPHCNKEVLDHMTQCPFCKGRLTPRGYSPTMDEATKRKIKRTTSAILWTIAGFIILFILLKNYVF